MAITPKTIDDFISDLIQFVENYNTANGTNYDIRQGTVLKDTLIDAPSTKFAAVNNDIAIASKIQSLNYASEISEDDLNDYGSNFSEERRGATFSTGLEDFIAETAPSTNITINSGSLISVPATINFPAIQFQTVETVVMDVSDLTPYEFIENGVTKYKISARIRAVVAGSSGNAGVDTITSLDQAIPGITEVRNPLATTSGTDIESNIDFAIRIKSKLVGNNKGTPDGIINLILEDSRVEDVDVVGPNDIEMRRNEFGGSVDVYILGSDLTSVVNSVIYTTFLGYIRLTKTPIVSVAQVKGIVDGVEHIFTLSGGTPEAIYVKDPGLLNDSIYEDSRITFPTATKPDNGTNVNVTLSYDKLIEDLQIEINKSSNSIIASDLVIRRSIQVTVDVYAQLSIFSGFSAATVADNVKTEVSDFIDSKKLGESINVSDLIAIIEAVDGVDSILVSTFQPSSDIEIFKNEVAQTGTISIRIGGILY